MNRHPNHCACPRCGSRSPEEPSEFDRAIAVAKLQQATLLKGLRDAVQGHGGQSVAETYGRGVALGRLENALITALS